MSHPITQNELDNCFLALAIARVALKANAGILQALSQVSAAEMLNETESYFALLADRIKSGDIVGEPEQASEPPSEWISYSWRNFRRKHPKDICQRAGCGHSASHHGEASAACGHMCGCNEFKRAKL